MYLLKNGSQVLAESTHPIEYNEKECAWLVISTDTSWYVDNPKSWTTQEVQEQGTPGDGGPSVIG